MERTKQVRWSLIATILMIGIMQFQGKILSERGFNIVKFELAKTIMQAEKIMNQWGSVGTQAAFWNTLIDFVFILAYTSFGYFSALKLTEKSINRTIVSIGKTMAYGMIAAGILDTIENLAMLQTLNGNISNAFTEIAYWCATFKFSIIVIVILSVLGLLLSKKRN